MVTGPGLAGDALKIVSTVIVCQSVTASACAGLTKADDQLNPTAVVTNKDARKRFMISSFSKTSSICLLYLITQLSTKLVFSVPVKLLFSATASQPTLTYSSHIIKKLIVAFPGDSAYLPPCCTDRPVGVGSW